MGREFAAIHPVEKAGIERTGEQLATADLVILVFDQSETWSAYDEALRRRWAEALVVHNKCDLPENGPRPAGIRVCARLGDGIPLLLASIVKRLVPTPPPPGAAVPFTTEQMQALERLQTAVLSK
jgi:tRNA modification GTPase